MNTPLPLFFEWLLRASWQAAVLTVLLLCVQFCLRKQLDGRWRHLLWFLVLARLVMPWSPPSAASLFNYVPFERLSAAVARPQTTPAPVQTAAPPRVTHAEISAPARSIPDVQPAPPPTMVAPGPEPPLPRAPKSPWTLPPWPVLLAAAWVAGVVALTARLVVQNILFRRRLRFATPLKNEAIVELFERCRCSLRVSSTVELRETNLVKSPALYGFFRLRLLLPPTLAGRFNAAELRHIFLHELGHVRRHDLHVQWLITGLQILHWFNPVIWFGFRRMAADRELACDELALGVVGEGQGSAYGQTIVKLLECCAESSPLPGLVGILEDKKQIFRRVRMIASFQRHPRWSIIGLTTVAVLALATLTGAQTEKTAAAIQPSSTNSARVPPSGETDQKVAAIVRDWENLPGVFNDVDTYAEQVRDLVRIGKPAVPGLCAALDHTERDTSMRLLGFTLRAIGDPRAVPTLIRAIPKTLLPPGSDCGVIAKNPDLLAFMRANDLDAGQAMRSQQDFSLGRPVREICGALAKITGTNVNQEEIYFIFLDGGEQQRAAERKAFYAVASRWADWWNENRQRFGVDPAMAAVKLTAPEESAATSRFLTGANVKTSEGAGGMYVAPLENGENCFLALSLNRLFGLPKSLSVSNGSVPVENASAWAAKAGADLMGMKYHDPQSGKDFFTLRGIGLQAWEIPNGHWATIEKDLQHDTLPALDTPAGDLLMHYDLASARYEPRRKATFLFITRDGSQGILRVTGQITRKPTPRDFGTPYAPPDDTDPDQSADFGPDLGVKFDYKFFYVETAPLKAEKEAREAAAQARVQASHSNKLAALLEKYPKLEGTVFSPAGQVVSNADILIYREGEGGSLANRRFFQKDLSTIFSTLADGHFTIPLIPQAHIYVAHQDGFAQMDLDETKSPLEIRLLPWGRIEGTVTLEGKPAPHQKLTLMEAGNFWPPSKPHLNLSFNTESDDQGRFDFEGVPPEEVKVYRMVGNGLFEDQVVKVAPGVTTFCEHGFNGRVIKGHFVTSDSSTIENWKNSLSLHFSTKSVLPDPPANEDPATWQTSYWQSEDGKKASRGIHQFAPTIEPNGDFQIEDVPPGTYELQANLYEGRGTSPFIYLGGKFLGHLKQDVTIPAPTAGPAKSPLDLGTLAVPIVVILRPGDLAPDFSVKTVNGEPLRLADFRGKYVLLDFWATWCGPCRGETPNLKAVHEACGAKANFAMVGLSLDKTADAPRDYSRTNGMDWAQGYLGDRSQTSLPDKYGVDGIPAIFLLDPDGKIVATGLRGENIKTAVQAALNGH